MIALIDGLVDGDPVRRRAALESLSEPALGDPTIGFALRRVLAADPDVATRALATDRVARLPGVGPGVAGGRGDPTAWLIDATSDGSPVVRDAAIRALARRRDRAAVAALITRAATDTTWWVRRAAIYALGVIAGDAAIAPLRAALADPFWRVRHAAVQVLAVHGNRDPALRAEILADVDGSSGDYLRALWGPTLVDEPGVVDRGSRLPAALRDRDPAVVTARLATMEAPPPLGLVELLCDPHVALRELVVARLVEAGDLEAFAAALVWLDEPRIPHVTETVVGMLDALGDPARALVERVLGGPARPGALDWALGWVVATRDAALVEVAWRRAVDAGRAGCALPLADEVTLHALVTDPHGPDDLACAAAVELRHRSPGARRAAADHLATAPACAELRARLVTLAATVDAWPAVEAALADPEVAPRAVALAALAAVGRLTVDARARAFADPDPAVREAALEHAPVDAIHALLAREQDPWVRRAAVGGLGLASGERGAGRAAIGALTRVLAADRDPWIRTHAVAALGADALDIVLELAADPSPMVQAAIAERLATVPDDELAAALEATTLTAAARVATAAWLAAAELEPVQAAAIEDVVRPAATARPRAVVTAATPEVPTQVHERRTFGRTGLAVTPLVISGAFDLAPGSLHVAAEAGVDLFFWEPTYAAMTRFLRAPRQRTRAHVVTGSYHADAASITLDVERALRRLRRDTLDLFLLFWARSAARLDDDAFAALDRLKQAGKIRGAGFSTHDRGLAIDALARAPWDVVMTRHSAAHPGIEAALLDHAQANGAGVLTFSALCYGRMLGGDNPPTAADCYRYSLSQAGVTACISAPRRHRELIENLEVVRAPMLGGAAVEALRTHGAGVRAENLRFNSLVRQPPREAAAAAMAMLEAALAPDATSSTPAALGRALQRGRATQPAAMLRRGRL